MELVEECGLCSPAAEISSQLVGEGGEYVAAERYATELVKVTLTSGCNLCRRWRKRKTFKMPSSVFPKFPSSLVCITSWVVCEQGKGL